MMNPPEFTNQTLKLQELVSTFGFGNLIATGFIIFIVLVNVFVYKLRQILEAIESDHQTITSTSTPSEECRRFSLAEIELATQSFDEGFVIGRGGFGKVYKGFFNNGSEIVAIKRLSSISKQGKEEFWMEIETLTKLRHVHLVSLIGYCNEGQEMILVYEYMPQGTLADHLCKIKGNFSPLDWDKRLKICIGAARGLDYLHTGVVPGIIHRDVKDSNILLNDNFVAKIADFGLAKLEDTGQLQSYVSTNVKGTFGYLDPEYFLTRRLSKKTDVYAFGVVLLVVLCGRPAVDTSVGEDQKSLVLWALERIKEGRVDNIIDPSLMGQISSDSLKEFVKVVTKCLQRQAKERPNMCHIVASLELALKQQVRQPICMSEGPGIVKNQQFEQGDIGSDATPLRKKRVNLEGRKRMYIRWPWEALSKKAKPLNQENIVYEGEISQISEVERYITTVSAREIVSKLNLRRFSFSELKSGTKNFKSDTMVGEGAFGKVYKAWLDNKGRVSTKKGSGSEIAISKLHYDSLQGFHEWLGTLLFNHFLGK